MKVLVIDIGGSNVKFRVWKHARKRSFPSGKSLTPAEMVRRVSAMTRDWRYDAVSIGFPGPVLDGKPASDPPNLAKGWTKFNFRSHLKKPVRIINDATMQALGSYRGGRMLFLGLGTGLGSTLILNDLVIPLELGELAAANGRKLVGVLGDAGLEKFGRRQWASSVFAAITPLHAAFRVDYIVIGGGNVDLLHRLPACARRGSNDNAFAGGALLWDRRRQFKIEA